MGGQSESDDVEDVRRGNSNGTDSGCEHAATAMGQTLDELCWHSNVPEMECINVHRGICHGKWMCHGCAMEMRGVSNIQ